MPYASRICSIFPLWMESKALVKSTNINVACRFFARTPSRILRMVNICEVVDLFLRKPFWFFLSMLSILGSIRFRTTPGPRGPELERWQWRGTLHSPKLQYNWNLTIRLFSVISRTLVGGVLPLFREAVGVYYSPSRLGNVNLCCMYVYIY